MIGTTQAISVLSKTAHELEFQAEVNSILYSIVTDIEIAHDLEQQINHNLVIANLQRKCNLAERALEEYKAMETEKVEERQKIGEVFLQELMALEEEMEAAGAGAGTEESGDSSINDSRPDNTIADYEGNETMAEEEEDGQQQQGQRQEDEQSNQDIPVVNGAANAPHEISDASQNGSYNPPLVLEQLKPANDGPDVAAGAAGPVSIVAVASQQSQIQSTTKERPPAVKWPPRQRPQTSLQHLNAQTLMIIFEYMDAVDILNMAQSNVQLYNKVDGIFGLGGTIIAGSRGMEEDEYDDDTPPVAIKEDDGADDNVDHQDVQETHSHNQDQDQGPNASLYESTGSISKSMSDRSVDSQQRATIVSIPAARSSNSMKSLGQTVVKIPQMTTKSSSSLAGEPTTAKMPAKVKMPTTVTLPPKKEATAASSFTFTAQSKSEEATAASSKTSTAGFQMSPAVAQSLAAKLLPAELSAIISMRDQLRKKEKELTKAEVEVDDLTVHLEGTITVKEMLTSKVKELQKTLKSDREISAKITRQTASDQEVIAFLDERVQELEKAFDNFHAERTRANKSIDKVKDASERQVAVLNDMLAYEREQRSDQEKDWKSTKKVLVKEVKHCRTQIMTLEAEIDGFREENQRLKEALLSLGVGSKSGRSFDTAMS